MAKRATLEEKTIKWKEAHSPKNEKGEYKDEKTGKAIPNKEQKQAKEKVKNEKINYKKYYKDENGKVDKNKKAMVKQIRTDYKDERAALKKGYKNLAEYRDERTRQRVSKVAGIAAKSGTMAATKNQKLSSVVGKGAEKAAYKGVEFAQRKTREKWAKNPEKYSKQIAQRVKAEKNISAHNHQNKHLTEAQLKYRMKNFDKQPSQKKMDNWVKENQAKPKTPKQKKPDYSSLYRNKDGTINKEKKALVKRAEKRYAQERKAYNKGHKSVASMKDENLKKGVAKGVGYVSDKAMGYAADKATEAAKAAQAKANIKFKTSNETLNKYANKAAGEATDKVTGKAKDAAVQKMSGKIENATYKAVGKAQEKHFQKMASNADKYQAKIADRVMDEKKLRSNNVQNKYLTVDQMKYRMRKEQELEKAKNQGKEASNGKKAEKPAKTQEAKKPEAKRTDEYGISVPEKKETKTEQKEQGRGR